LLRLLVTGRPTAEIARMLNVSAKTVANYHSLIKQKLGVGNDIELMLWASRHVMR
jgi:two-component system, NarL family, invasion response regulator UvrY